MIYIFRAHVVSVYERFVNLPAEKDAAGKWYVPSKSEGWYVRISEGSAILLGDEKPDIQAGDMVELRLQKIPPKEGIAPNDNTGPARGSGT